MWSWQRAHSTLRPRKARPSVLTRSTTYSVRYSSATMPPSWLCMWLRLKPVAIRCSCVGVGQEIAGELPGDEVVDAQVAVERRDHPVAPRPHLAHAVVLVAVRVGVARDVEPVGGHALAVGRRRQQAIDDALVGVGGAVGEERVDLGRRRRQPGQIEGHAPQPGLARRLGRRLPALRLERGAARSDRSRRVPSRSRRPPAAPASAGGMNAQCGFHSAPCSIQRISVAFSTSSSVRCESAAGIITLGSVLVMRRTSSLLRRAARHDGAMARTPASPAPMPARRAAARPCAAGRPDRGT